MTRISGICGKCGKYYQGGWCPICEKLDIDRTLNFITDFHDSYYDHGLGAVVKSRQHRKSLMKEKGLEEVGNEWKHIDPKRQYEAKDKKFEKELKSLEEKVLRQWR